MCLKPGKSIGPDRCPDELTKTMTDEEFQIAKMWVNEILTEDTSRPGFLATRVLPGAIGHSILRTSVKPRYTPLSNSRDRELVLLSSHDVKDVY